jgi:hypothetical protein
MRNMDEILAETQMAVSASLHQASEAGRAHTASEFKSRMAAFFEGLVPRRILNLIPRRRPTKTIIEIAIIIRAPAGSVKRKIFATRTDS